MSLLVLSQIPIDPDADQARQWLQEELEKDIYHPRPGIFARILQWLFEAISRVGVPKVTGNLPIGFIITVLVICLLVLTFALAIGGWLKPYVIGTSPNKKIGAIFDDERTRPQYLAAAQEAAIREDWVTACIEMFRAIVKRMDDDCLITLMPATTALEAANQCAKVIRNLKPDLLWAATNFNWIRYGRGNADGTSYQRLVLIDQMLTTRVQPQEVAISG